MPPKRIISFDVGIKNMAYCIFDISGSQQSIIDWNVLNLMEEEITEKKLCNCMTNPKTKKTVSKVCGKIAKYTRRDDFFCDKHAKENIHYLIPSKQCSQTELKKKKNEELKQICIKYNIADTAETTLKRDLLEKMFSFFESKTFSPIQTTKMKSSKEVDLISIGKRMKILLNAMPDIGSIDIVLIENQISPIATRMKTIQGMLSQYFIMINENIIIKFISSSNKLRTLPGLQTTTITEPIPKLTQGEKYKQNKRDGVSLCSQILDKNDGFKSWKSCLDTKKKDDLADCFLQGIWWITKKNL
jgi:arsenate reductase-like glutaredoxin family protein